MAKIKLDVDKLRVESFGTDDASQQRGTVHGREFTGRFECPTVWTGNAKCTYCQNSGNASCVWCEPDTGTCQDCSWTDGDGAQCYW